ncbi:hypothetical protein PMAYCL1PPCAC_14217, partial [Pristionchus mayeri]
NNDKQEIHPDTSKRRVTSCKGESKSKSVKNKEDSQGNKTEKNELKCPECEYRSRSVDAWEKHLIRKHSTTAALAGYLVRCDCGHESYSKKHSSKCEISNFTIIRNGNRPIRRLTDRPVSEKEQLFQKYPKTPCGYTKHLKIYHKTTLLASGIYLLCSCGIRYNSHHDKKKHRKKCTGQEFTLHRRDEATTPQCVLCQMHPKTPCGYLYHLRVHHKTTLLKNGIYVLCSCGMRYNSHNDQRKHDKKCNGCEYTLHKLDED